MLTFGKLTIDSADVPSRGSKNKVSWTCECGKTALIRFQNVANGNTTTCGKCNLVSADEIREMKFGSLTVVRPQDVTTGSGKVLDCVCACGKTALVPVHRLFSGQKRSCGRCDEISAEDISVMKFGKLRMTDPAPVLPGSGKKVDWTCDCGNTASIQVILVMKGKRRSCGKCRAIPASAIARMKFGSLKVVDPPPEVFPNSEAMLVVKCDCGLSTRKKAVNLLNGKTVRCGRCNEVSADEMGRRKFGLLRMKDPAPVLPGSRTPVTWLCDCGGTVDSAPEPVFRGRKKTCGDCRNRAAAWFRSRRTEIRGLSCPVSPRDFPPGGPEPLEEILKARDPFLAKCPICKSEYRPALHNVKRGQSLSCGCQKGNRSLLGNEIVSFLGEIGVEAVPEHRLDGVAFDVFIPRSRLLIEVNGLYWHSLPRSKENDARKAAVASENGLSLIVIFEDEWRDRGFPVRSLLQVKTGKISRSGIRPSSCEMADISAKDADLFYDKFHYMGRSRSPVNLAVFHDGNPVACMSFGRPTRQTSRHTWELSRMASDPSFVVHGIWSKLFKSFLAKHRFESVVSFSDNRLFSGEVYGKMGFRLDGETRPDYYWVKGDRRFHKSSLRKTEEERLTSKTETELRESQGYRKMWDLGKKRWVFDGHNPS